MACTLAHFTLFTTLGLFFRENITLVDPHLNTNHAVRKVRLFFCEIDICTECLERYAATLNLLGATHFCATQATGNADANTLHVAVCHNFFYRLLEHAAECLSFLQPFGDHVGHHRCLRFR